MSGEAWKLVLYCCTSGFMEREMGMGGDRIAHAYPDASAQSLSRQPSHSFFWSK